VSLQIRGMQEERVIKEGLPAQHDVREVSLQIRGM